MSPTKKIVLFASALLVLLIVVFLQVNNGSLPADSQIKSDSTRSFSSFLRFHHENPSNRPISSAANMPNNIIDVKAEGLGTAVLKKRPFTGALPEENQSNPDKEDKNKKASLIVANQLPTDAEIMARLETQNQKKETSDSKLSARDVKAKSVSAEVRGMGSEALSTVSSVSAPKTPPADVVAEVKSGKYIAH